MLPLRRARAPSMSHPPSPPDTIAGQSPEKVRTTSFCPPRRSLTPYFRLPGRTCCQCHDRTCQTQLVAHLWPQNLVGRAGSVQKDKVPAVCDPARQAAAQPASYAGEPLGTFMPGVFSTSSADSGRTGLWIFVRLWSIGQIWRGDSDPFAIDCTLLCCYRSRAVLLLNIEPQLPAQLNAIAREFSLPSIGGLTLHLSITENGQSMKPRITEEAYVFFFLLLCAEMLILHF
jgi:hypothetical protein